MITTIKGKVKYMKTLMIDHLDHLNKKSKKVMILILKNKIIINTKRNKKVYLNYKIVQ